MKNFTFKQPLQWNSYCSDSLLQESIYDATQYSFEKNSICAYNPEGSGTGRPPNLPY